jgi:hypothetical protein
MEILSLISIQRLEITDQDYRDRRISYLEALIFL